MPSINDITNTILSKLSWKNGVTRAIVLGMPPDGWVLSSDGFYYPQATWNNGITKQTEKGFPPAGWSLQPDGFYYPPILPFTPDSPTALVNYIVFNPDLSSLMERSYIHGSMAQIDAQEIIITNISQNLSINVEMISVPGVIFNPAQILIPAGDSRTIQINFDSSKFESLPDGVHQIELFFNLSIATVNTPSTNAGGPNIIPKPLVTLSNQTKLPL